MLVRMSSTKLCNAMSSAHDGTSEINHFFSTDEAPNVTEVSGKVNTYSETAVSLWLNNCTDTV